ncbi:MAG: L-lactate dehydrogenase [Balneolaceae bacterium]|nr:L-lactate dehydrogenase [Balneolaceae bacterium]
MTSKSIGIIGMGWVGSSVAISILHQGLCRKLLVNDINKELAVGEAMDLNHGSSFFPSTDIYAADIEDMLQCDAIVITAGRGGNPGESRLDLLSENIRIVRDISCKLKGYKGLLIIVSNPVDVLTYYYQKYTGMAAQRVIGTGTMLDISRLREMIGKKLHIDPKAVHAQVIGEHGDSEVILWSNVMIEGTPLRKWNSWKSSYEDEISDQLRMAAAEIIKRKGATNHAIGLVTATLLTFLLRDENRILTVSSVISNLYGIDRVALSLPSVISSDGIREVLEIDISKKEYDKLHASVNILKKAIRSVGRL